MNKINKMNKKSNIKKDDKVKVIAGKDKGKISKVLKVFKTEDKLLVENVNMMKKHTRPNAQNKQGGIVESEAKIHVSNVMLMCNKCMLPMRPKIQKLEDGDRKRVCRKCNEIV